MMKKSRKDRVIQRQRLINIMKEMPDLVEQPKPKSKPKSKPKPKQKESEPMTMTREEMIEQLLSPSPSEGEH